MSYICKQLVRGETLIEMIKLHPFVYVSTGLLVIMAALTAWYIHWFLSVLLLILALLKLLSIITKEYAITSSRVILKEGIIGIKCSEISLDKIEDVSVDQPPIQRIIQMGTIMLRGTGGSSYAIEKIQYPSKIKNLIEQHRP